MSTPLTQLLHESLSAAPPQVSLPGSRVLKALEQEADRQHKTTNRLFILSMLSVMIPPQLESLLISPTFPWGWARLGGLALIAAMALVPSWVPAFRKARALPLQKRFQEIAKLRVISNICFCFGVAFLFAALLKHQGLKIGFGGEGARGFVQRGEFIRAALGFL